MITWRSPRPMSAAGLVRRGGVDLFVKRHHVRVRTPAQLGVEHAFIGHLRARGIPAPAVLRTADGATATQHGDFVYEVHEVAAASICTGTRCPGPPTPVSATRGRPGRRWPGCTSRRTASRCRPALLPCSPAAAS